MTELRSAIFWVLCPKQSLHCYSPWFSVHCDSHFRSSTDIYPLQLFQPHCRYQWHD
ncbi:MAG: hypothetical protein IM597_20010 [Pseudanabaena sp. M176S2SP2A07QC]|nr:hypothetical protein [Pseudanabaena sp. M176S2SP2A07QC]MCA6538524.1 hypothetical protein [Pseudanabaena sp. M037S2SP2A07QC]MCA6562950.1 hypothetical protein [Pseudanabaena sp. M151S2SP2A07QC]MCA6579178.1 hypothetical protein [Pseudanabaena sp. M085S1SP2A07QC]